MTKKLDFQQNKFYFWRENSTYFPKNSPIFPRFFFVSLEFFALKKPFKINVITVKWVSIDRHMFTIDAFGPSGNGNDFHLIHDVSILAQYNSRQDFSPGMRTGLTHNHLGELVHHQFTNLVRCVLRQRKVRYRNCRS